MTTRICPGCKLPKDCASDFYNRAPSQRSGRRDGKHSRCIECCKQAKRKVRTCGGCGITYYHVGTGARRRTCLDCNLIGKPCGICDEFKPYSEYYLFTGRKRYGSACKSCLSLQNVEARYGLPPGGAAALYESNGNKCGICGAVQSFAGKKKLHVDHCHTTDAVRGLLCGFCNSGLGYFKDSPELLQAAVEYLNRPYLLT